ncbi:MAG: error-prone DNA polymerase [Hyphomonadaceae bacterium]|nr:error-prone DNA polymerase [Hyphomonadaceae bacterium]
MSGFAELCITTNFSFLRSGSHPEEMVEQAIALGLSGIGIADRNTLAGVVRAHVKARTMREQGKGDIRTIVGCRLVFRDGTPDLVAYPKDRAGYANLTRLLTLGNKPAPKGECWLNFSDYLAHAEGLQTILIPACALGDEPYRFGTYLQQIQKAAGEVWLAAPFQFNGEDRRRIKQLKQLASQTGARLIATTEPLMHHADARPLLDVVTCIREKKTLNEAGALLAKNAERQLKSVAEIARIFADAPEAVAESLSFLQSIEFSMDQLRYEYPEETSEGYPSPQEALKARAWEGAAKFYPDEIPQKIKDSLARELAIVEKKQYAPYFLTVADIVEFARSDRDKDGGHKIPILCQGRGSAANSTICYCLGITSVDPNENVLLFDRFVSEERNEPPDIDVDFQHERREEVIQYIYHKYGRDRAALTATLICYRGRSAIREVAKVFGYSEDSVSSLSKMLHWWSKGVEEKDLLEHGFDISDQKLMDCVELANKLQGFPRHLSQHVGGFVITREKVHDVVPVQNARMDDRTVVEWNKDDLEALGILKVDVLGLGMLTCLQKAFDLHKAHYPGEECITLRTPPHNERVYAMLHRADSIGVFQVESRAQMSMLPRLRPSEFYDLVIEVAIVRPGPIQGGMVHPYLKRRDQQRRGEKIVYPGKELEPVLQRTLGVPLFQEQAMQIAIVGAGFKPAEADKLRRAMATFRRVGTIDQLKDKFISGMIGKGYDKTFAEACFSQIEGFGEYGFPESHAASFAILVYVSSWLKCFYPDVFAAALLNAQPMGFYAPAQIVRDAIDHGVDVRPIDVNCSDWDNTLEANPNPKAKLHPRHAEMAKDIKSTHALRLGFRQGNGLREEALKRLVANRGNGYDSVRSVWLKSGLDLSTIERLADMDAFRSLGLDRRDALWVARGLNRVGGQEDLPLFECATVDRTREPDFDLPSMCLGEHIVEDYRTIGLSLKAHPVSLLREELLARRVIKAEQLTQIRNGERVRVSGLVLVRQRPGTASGVIFMTLEDETGIANIVVWPKLFEQYRREVLGGRLVAIDGPVQSESGVIHVIAERVHDYTPLLAKLSAHGEKIDPSGPADEPRRSGEGDARQRHPRDVRINLDVKKAASVMPKGRNFH